MGAQCGGRDMPGRGEEQETAAGETNEGLKRSTQVTSFFFFFLCVSF